MLAPIAATIMDKADNKFDKLIKAVELLQSMLVIIETTSNLCTKFNGHRSAHAASVDLRAQRTSSMHTGGYVRPARIWLNLMELAFKIVYLLACRFL